jgi:hypothetical protein
MKKGMFTMPAPSRFRQASLPQILWIALLLTLLSPPGQPRAWAASAAPSATITVNSGTDPDNSDSRTCLTHTPCTLRRAVIQARNAGGATTIAFNIPAEASEGYDSAAQVWKIQFSGISSAANATLRYLNGNITIDGTTQPGYIDKPVIFLVGEGTGQRDGIKLGETGTQNGNVLRGLGFQNFKTHVYVNSSSNLVEKNWFGLNPAGNEVVLRGGGADDGSGNTGVSIAANTDNNRVQDNVFTGLAGVAAALNGDQITFTRNYIGTTAAGTVPAKQTAPGLICSPVDWLGGSGISMSGDRITVSNNVLAGLRIAVVPPTIQADAIRVSGDDHVIENNQIGRDVNGVTVGVCGRGIYLQGGTERALIRANQIIEPGLSAISLNDTPVVSTTDANTLRGNVIVKSGAWGEIEGNNSPEDAIQITKSLPDAFRSFLPAAVTSIHGRTVSGGDGAASPCPGCVIEIFLDDTDAITETLQSLAVVTATVSGAWTATLPLDLSPGQGVRTTSTSSQYNTIPAEGAGTTTGLSGLYLAVKRVHIPIVRR